MKAQFAEAFRQPGASYAPHPFWFINDAFSRDEAARQIADMKAKGVGGFVLHPRIGIPKEVEYLSDEFMENMTFCVQEASRLGMQVILYDEGMYPSGSACGQVAAQNPEYASRILYCTKQAEYIPEPMEKILAAYDVKTENGTVTEYTAVPENAPVPEERERHLIVFGFSHGHIRGIHFDQDDGGPDAPLSADLLSFEAMQTFIRLTHERYYSYMKEYFGSTVIAFFTDEPMPLGRSCSHENARVWTKDFLQEVPGIDLFALFRQTENSAAAEAQYTAAMRGRFKRSYYGQLKTWCNAHGIALMGHPAESNETDLQEQFDIPGQDIVMHWLHPDNALTTVHSLVGKSSADMARQLGRRRNADEVLGVCGEPGNPWNFSCSSMMWYFNFLFARGVNFVVPHAFYYSLRTPLQFGERPPDVGSGNIWWPHYGKIAGYIARMSWLNTDSVNVPQACVLCGNADMPLEPVRALYENGVDFNYLNAELLVREHRFEDGSLCAGAYRYDTVLLEESLPVPDGLRSLLDECRANGVRVYRGSDFYGFLKKSGKLQLDFFPNSPFLRRVHLKKDGLDVFLLINECDSTEQTAEGFFPLPVQGKTYRLDPFTGEAEETGLEKTEYGTGVYLNIPPYGAAVLAVDAGQPALYRTVRRETVSEIPVPMQTGAYPDNTKPRVYTGTVHTEKDAALRYVLQAAEVQSMGEVYVNGAHAGTFLMKPFRLDITGALRAGENSIRVEVIPSKANSYGTPVDVCMTPCTLLAERTTGK